MDLSEFFKTVTTGGEGWFCLAYARIEADEAKTRKTWREEFHSWPDELPTILNRVSELKDRYDVYFSPYLFEDQRSTKDKAIAGHTIVADLDDANVLTLPLQPNILVETSPGRHQGYWILKEQLDSEEHESLSRRLTYSIPRCDLSGWFLGKKVRVPETNNNKYIDGPKYIRIVQQQHRIYTNQELQEVATPRELYGPNSSTKLLLEEENLEWMEGALEQSIGPQEMLARIRSTIPTVVARYGLLQQDRSAALWALNMALFRAGLSKDKIFFIAYHSPNNKFKDLKFGGLRELAKDVSRAELAIKRQLPDIKGRISEARKLGSDALERNNYIAKCVREHLEKIGTFLHCVDDGRWYIREDIGRPIQVSPRNEGMLHLFDNMFGINASEKEASFIGHHLSAVVADMPVTGRVATLSQYDHDSRTFTLHTGRKDILVVSAGGVRRETNGYNGIVFPWMVGNTAISPYYKSMDMAWEDELFDNCLDNILGISKQAAKAILKVWFLSVLMRDGLTSRPILALFGTPGSGKSTLFRRVYALMYGRERGLNTVTKEDDFDQAMANDSLVVLDNVDSAEKWLPDRLAATIAPTEILRRKLYTDNDTFILRRQAMLGITAHNPKFSREDVTDRLLLLNFERLTHFISDSTILDRIVHLRNVLWGAILRDIQTILGTQMPMSGHPQFRIEDFAVFGHWLALSLGIEEEFREGLESVRQEQKVFNLEEDTILIDAIDRYLTGGNTIHELAAGALWLKLSRYSGDERGFTRRYGNAVSLGRKMWTLMESLREVYNVEWTTKRGVRQWTVTRKSELHTKVGANGKAEIG